MDNAVVDSEAQEEKREIGAESAQAPNLRRITSISEAAEASSDGCNAPMPLKICEIPFRVKNPKDGRVLPEAVGWAMDAAAQGPLVQVGSYVGAAILRLAAKDVGCQSPLNCNNPTQWGLKPSSLLTASSAIVGILTALLMPFVGAIVDHTRYRKHMGIIAGIFVVALTGTEIMINEDPNNWLLILILDSIQSFTFAVHLTAVFAYLPDLTTDHDVIPHYTSQFNIRQFCSQFLFTSLLLIVNSIRQNDQSLASSVQLARDSLGITFGISAFCIGYAWTFLFRNRPALSKAPNGQNIFITSLSELQRTVRKIWRDYRALRWFFVSLLWSPEAGSGVVLAIAVSFLTVDLGFTGQDLVKLTLVLLTGNIVGAIFSKWVTGKHLNPLNSYRCGLTCLSFVIAITSVVLDSPDKKPIAHLMISFWGLTIGWTYSVQRVLFCTLIPKGQETEMMGLVTFTNQIFGWLPPLIVTIMNENQIQLRWGFSVVAGFCILACLCTGLMGDYNLAIAQVSQDSESKFNQVLESTLHQGDRSR